MADLTPVTWEDDPVLVPADVSGDQFANDGNTVLWVYNGSGSSVTVTKVATRKCDHGFLDHDPKTIGPGVLRMVGPFPANRYGLTAQVTYSSVSGVQVGPQQLPDT